MTECQHRWEYGDDARVCLGCNSAELTTTTEPTAEEQR